MFRGWIYAKFLIQKMVSATGLGHGLITSEFINLLSQMVDRLRTFQLISMATPQLEQSTKTSASAGASKVFFHLRFSLFKSRSTGKPHSQLQSMRTVTLALQLLSLWMALKMEVTLPCSKPLESMVENRKPQLSRGQSTLVRQRLVHRQMVFCPLGRTAFN